VLTPPLSAFSVSPPLAKHLDRECQVEDGTDRRRTEATPKMTLAQTRIDERRFPTRVGADQKARIRLFDVGNRRIEQVTGAASWIELGAVLTTVEARSAEGRSGFPSVQTSPRPSAQIAGDRGDLSFARNHLQAVSAYQI